MHLLAINKASIKISHKILQFVYSTLTIMFDAERRVYAASIYIYTHLYLHASRSMNFTIISTNASFLT